MAEVEVDPEAEDVGFKAGAIQADNFDRLTPLTIPIGPRPETALRLILGEGAGATAEGAEEGAAVEAFMQSLRFVQTELDCHVLLEEHHVPGRPGFSEEVIDGVVRHSLLLRLAVRAAELEPRRAQRS